MMNQQYGVIQEQGDLGMFYELNQKDNQIYQESLNQNQQQVSSNQQVVIAEEKKD